MNQMTYTKMYKSVNGGCSGDDCIGCGGGGGSGGDSCGGNGGDRDGLSF